MFKDSFLHSAVLLVANCECDLFLSSFRSDADWSAADDSPPSQH